MKILLSVALVMMILSSSQDGDDREIPLSCDLQPVINNEKYKNAPSDQLTINSLAINDNCLQINFSSSGCDGDTWGLELVVSELILFSRIPQRNVRLSLQNEELCRDVITKELTFDISNLQVDGNEVRLNITNSDKSIMYEY